MSDRPPIAWFAGVIDARAHLESHNRHGHVQPRVRVTTREEALLEELARWTGAKVVLDDRAYSRRPCGEHCQNQHSHIVRQSKQWTVDSARATILLHNLLPYLRVKRERAVVCVQAGLLRFPPARGDTHTQMLELGWEMPKTDLQLRAVS
jgi:hypothetical protein